MLASFSYGAGEDGLAFRASELVTTPPKPEKIKKHVWFSSQGEASGRIILVGDSHMAAIAPKIRRWSLANGYDVAGSIFEGCPLIAGMQRVAKADLSVRNSCSLKTQNRRLKFINSQKPSIVIMGARLPIFAEETRFDNEEGGFEGENAGYITKSQKNINNQS